MNEKIKKKYIKIFNYILILNKIFSKVKKEFLK